MTHKAAIIHGKTFMILMPLANHYSLEVFFWEGQQPPDETGKYVERYIFGEKFPKIKTDADLHKAVIKQMFQLADALLWLHHGLGDFEEPNSYLAHMDLKPDNILIHGNPEEKATPVGQWMLTDFGISAFHKDSHKLAQDMPTIRSMTSRLTSLSVRGRGPYQPPEIGLKRKKEEFDSALLSRHMLDFRECDVWSFGCVLSDVLAFALRRRRGVKEIRARRTQDGNDNFYKFIKNLDLMDQISPSNTELKQNFVTWGVETREREREAKPWVLGCLDIIFKDSIVPCPTYRKRFGDIKTSLRNLEPRLNSTSYSNLNDHGGFGTTQTETRRDEGSSGAVNYRSLGNGVAEPSGSNLANSSNAPAHHQQLHIPNSGKEAMNRSQSVPVYSSNDTANLRQLRIVDGNLLHSSVPIPIDKEASVKAVALDSTGEFIAILCETKFFTFSTRQPRASIQKPLDISAEVTWNNVRIAHPELAIYGAKSSGEIVVSYAIP